MNTTLTPLRLIRITARLLSILLFLLWGSLFIEHLAWFFPPIPKPPLWVWASQIIHFGLMLSYLYFFWKEKIAALIMVSCAFIFFFFVIGGGGAIAYFLLSIGLAILFGISH
ncbi:MAG TPA: hypothetical protein VF338_02830, partial [Leptolinea sp.]